MKMKNRLEEQNYNGSLEEFLSAFYKVILNYKDLPLTGALLSKILNEAWTVTSSQLDDYVGCSNPPDEDDVQNEFVYLQQMLLYQVQDLRLMRETGLLDGVKYNAEPILSPTDHHWYNWSVKHFVSVLEPYPDSLDCNYTWKEIADYLYEAQIYE